MIKKEVLEKLNELRELVERNDYRMVVFLCDDNGSTSDVVGDWYQNSEVIANELIGSNMSKKQVLANVLVPAVIFAGSEDPYIKMSVTSACQALYVNNEVKKSVEAQS